MKHIVLTFFLSVLLYAKATYTVAIVVDGDTKNYTVFEKELRHEIKKILARDFYVKFPKKLRFNGRWNYKKIASYVNKALRSRADLVLTIGTLSSNYVARKKRYAKPVVATSVINPDMQGIPYNKAKGISGKHNLTYINADIALDEDVATIKELFKPKKIAVLINAKLVRNTPQIQRYVLKTFRKNGFKNTTVVPVHTDVDKILAAIAENIDFVYVTPLFELDEDKKRKLYALLVDRGIKTFSAAGYDDVLLGALLANNSSTDVKRYIRQIALNVQQIALGFEAGRQPVNFISNQSLYLNLETAEKIGFKPSWELVSRATIVETQSTSYNFVVEAIIDRALSYNLDVIASSYRSRHADVAVDEAQSLYFPQLQLGAEAIQIDQDRATASLGLLNETRADVHIALSQQLYNQKVVSQVGINKHLARSQKHALDYIKLDISLKAALSYLHILKLENTLKIQKRNLELTKQNLKSSLVRKKIGIGSAKDIYRWESKLANDKRSLLYTLVAIKQAKNDLFALLDMPLDSDVHFADIDIDHPVFLTHRRSIRKYFVDQDLFDRFEGYLLDLMHRNMPSLAQYEATLKAREALLDMRKKEMFIPEVSVEAVVRQHFIQASNDVRDNDPNLQAYPYADNTDWDIGVIARYPLFTGGRQSAQIQASKIKVLEARTKQKKLRNTLEAALRNALYRARASFLSIQLAQEALASAKKNLDVTADIYNQGNSSIIYLLDAQSDTLRAALQLNDIKYDFMRHMLSVQYYTGRVDYSLDEAAWKEWFEALRTFSPRKGRQ